MHILITGSQGFIGSHLVTALLGDGNLVSGLDVNINSNLINEQNYRHVQGNVLDREVLQEAMREVECVIHLAAEHQDRGIPAERYFEVNEIGTRTVLECAAEKGIEKLVFFSSAAVYGRLESATEETDTRPVTVYGASKLKAEVEVGAWVSANPVRKAVVMRPTAVYGPGNRSNIYQLISLVCDGRFVWVGKGNNVKSVAYVGNLVEATRFLVNRLEPGLQVYNYSDEPQLRMKQLVDLIAKKAQVKVSRLHIPYPVAVALVGAAELLLKLSGSDYEITAGRLKKFCMPSEVYSRKIRKHGFRQRYTIDEGLEKTVAMRQITKL